jgi:hypothetical protein
MKIALITIHNVSNYGTVLQAFATKKILSQYGEVETINYFNPHLFPDTLELIRFKLSKFGVRLAIRDLLLFKDRYQVVRKFKNFMKSNLNLSRLVTQRDIQSGVINNFDVYVCGSDQIWNPKIVSDGKLDPIYFLSFANKKAKKIAYASSMGAYRLRDSDKEQVKDLLKDFTTISVRESNTQAVLSQLLEREVHQVLDPVLLLSKEEWLEALKINTNYRSQQEDYILVYMVIRDPLLKKVADFFANQLGIKVVTIEQEFKPLINNADFHIRNAGPIEFIELFANARFVITSSFHGTSFSINFKKPFVSVCSTGTANRLKSLLSLFGLEDRFINDERDIDKISTDLDHEFSENQLKRERAKSIKILSSSIVS